jgi:hypothetical protein
MPRCYVPSSGSNTSPPADGAPAGRARRILPRDHQRKAAGRAVFGGLDPSGDFDLLFGAATLSLKIVEMPVRHLARTDGRTRIRRFDHGLLLKILLIAIRRLKPR